MKQTVDVTRVIIFAATNNGLHPLEPRLQGVVYLLFTLFVQNHSVFCNFADSC